MDTVHLAFEQDLAVFVKTVKSRNKDDSTLEKSINKQAKSNTILFNLWNNYEAKLEKKYFEEKVLIIGEFLFSIGEYSLAVNHCFMRYLLQFGKNDAPFSLVSNGWAVDEFKKLYFSNGLENEETVKIMRTLLGIAISQSLHVLSFDPKLKNRDSLKELISCLKFIQISMQIALEREVLCWLVYNGTINIYTVCRQMMLNGHSKYALEYLIWACVSMESSVPLMTTKYLSWRCQLYTAVCHCYYDINLGLEAENFARRGLNQIQELQEIEKMSSSNSNNESKSIFKGASLRMKMMIFKRNVFESRRRPRGILRPKNKPPLKEIAQNPWPRTTTERMLSEAFQGRSAQLLAVIEALTDSKRRIAQTSLGAPESDDSILDVFAELFFAGCELIAGGGGTRAPSPGKHESVITDNIEDVQLIDMAVKGEDKISISGVVKFVQLAYNYESWEVFESLVQPIINCLRPLTNNEKHFVEMKSLEVLQALLPINMNKFRKKVTLGMEEKDSSEAISTKHSSARVTSFVDDMLKLVNVIESCICGDKSKIIISGMKDILVDSSLYLWNRCKSHYSRVTSYSTESFKSATQDPNLEKWIRALVITQKAMLKVGLGDIDVSACVEASLKAALLLEFLCGNNTVTTRNSRKNKADDRLNKEDETEAASNEKLTIVATAIGCAPSQWNVLLFAKKLLKDAINAINNAKANSFDENAKIVDYSLRKDTDASSTNHISHDASALHLELIFVHHRIDCKLSLIKSGSKESSKTTKKHEQIGMSSCCGKDRLLKAIYLICKSELIKTESNKEECHEILKEAIELLEKTQKIESKLANECIQKPTNEVAQPIPPPPLLVYRSATSMVFRPALFAPPGKDDVYYYRFFMRNASGNNVKVRLSDTQFPGTGIEVINNKNAVFIATGLMPLEKYVVAVAAYGRNGQLIGDSIGQTSMPILASTPLPIGLAYGHLAKVAYNVGSWDLAKRAFNVLWHHFVVDASSLKEESEVKTARENTELILHQLNMTAVEGSSSILIRYFVQTIFISVDIAVREGALFSDLFCDMKPPFPGQTSRLEECKKLLIALSISGILNDHSICLQTVVLCYGLLAPLLQMEIHFKPILQILLPCFAALQELQSVIKLRKPASLSENLQHMVSAITFYAAKVLEKHQQKYASTRILESGSKILTGETQSGVPDSASTSNNTVFGSGPSKKLTKKNTLKKMKLMAGKPGMKGLIESTTSENISNELKILETYLQRMRHDCEHNIDDEALELTGIEEAPHVHAVLSCLPPQAGFKEVSKFKRRAQYLEHFVHVLDRGLKEGLQSLMIDWTRDAVMWLTRRNEVLLNKQASDQRGGTVVVPTVDDEKNRKFSAAIVEYGKTAKAPASRELLPIAESPRQAAKKEEKVVESKSVQKQAEKKNRTKGQIQLTDSEKKLKDASQKLQDLLPDYFKMVQRRRRLRSVSYEELPWRTQMNLLMSRCFCDLSKEKFKALLKFHSLIENPRSSDLMDPNWFSLSTSETLIVSWAGNPKQSETEIEPTIDIGGQNIDHTDARTSGSLRIDHISGKGKIIMKNKSGMVKSHKRDHDDGTQNVEDPVKVYLTYVQMALLYLKRSMVLARRGKNWILLQNTARELYNFSNEIHRKVISLANVDFLKSHHRLPLNVAKIRDLFWSSFYTAADCLLDMMNYSLWNMKEKVDGKASSLTSSEKLFNSNVRDHNGGSNLEFDPIFDDVSTTSLIWLKRIIWYAIEMLYYEEKWEKVVDLIYRFCALSRDKFAESLVPIMIFAQRKIQDRLNTQPGPPKEQPRVIFDKETGIPMAAYLDPPDTVSIEAGAHIDPEGHNLYNPVIDGLQLVSVPMNINENMERLAEALNSKQYSARALEHCRKLLILFLAGRQNGMNSKAKLRLGSRVSFIASQVQPQDAIPPDLSQESFEDRETVEKYPLGDNQLAIIISAYDKTIEILRYRKQTGLAAQAMHELGNIMFNSENTRLAYKWWLETLDLILKSKDALKSWRNLLSPENSIRTSKSLLDRCGIWGCLLGAVLASKIARYIHTFDLGMRSEFCQLSAALFQALLCTSLPHPSAFIDYACYDVGLQHAVTQLIPGVDLFSDPFRADCSTVLSSIYWTASELIRAGFYFQALPLLSICQYIAVDVCKDIQKSVDIKILRIKALSGLNLFSDAIKHLGDIFRGKNLPIMALNKQPKVTQITQRFGLFDNSKKVNDANNYKVLKELCCANLANTKAEIYGSKTCERIELVQAHILNKIAYSINAVAENEVIPSTSSASTEAVVDVKRSSSKSKRQSNKKKPQRSKAGSPSVQSKADLGAEEASLQSTAKIKGALLNTVEKIVTRVKSRADGGKQSEGNITSDKLSAEDLQLSCECEEELASVAEQRLCTITAAKHIFNVMKQIEVASVLEENEDTDDLQKLPWSSGRLYPEESIVHANANVNIDARQWLYLRVKIASFLCSLIKMPIGDQPKITENAIGTFEYHVTQGVEEAEAFNDEETFCKLKMLSIQNSIQCGEDIDRIINDLKNVIKKMTSFKTMSFELRLLFLEAKIIYNDLQAVNGTLLLSSAVSCYRQLLHEMLTEVVFHGNDINAKAEMIVMPLSNIYDPLLTHVVAMKLRIGKCLALEFQSKVNDVDSCAQHLHNVNRILLESLDISQKLAKEVPVIDSEMAFIRGLLMRQLFEIEKVELRDVLEAMIEAVRVQTKHTPDLSILRKIYQEIALSYMTISARTEASYLKLEKQRQLEEGEKDKDRIPSSGKSSSLSIGSSKQTIQQQKQLQAKRDKEARAREKHRQSIRKAAWVAVRTAGAIAKAQKKFEYLATEAVAVSEETKELSAPDFALFEILNTDAVLKDDDSGCTVNSGVVRVKNRFGNAEFYQFSWSHVINYTRALKKQTSYVGMGLGTSKINLRNAFGMEKYALKMEVMHNFLKESLTIYEKECCPILPTDFFMSFTFDSLQASPVINVYTDSEDGDGKRGEKTADATAEGATVIQKEAEGTTSGRDSSLEMARVLGKVADRSDRIHSRDPFQAGDFEVAMQWHRPELSMENKISLLFAMNSKAVSITDKPASFAGIAVVNSHAVTWPEDLHHSLTELFHAAESELNQSPGILSKTAVAVQAASALSSVSPTRRKKPLGIKPISMEQDKEDQLKSQLKDILDKIETVFNKSESQDAQFEVSFQNISCLENLFNPNYGNISKTSETFFNWLQYLLNEY